MAKGGYRGGSMMGMNQQNMIKQAQKMQQELIKMQQELETAEYSSTSGGGAVTATVNGKKEVIGLTIAPEAVDPEDIEMLCDMIIAAVNSAIQKAEESANAGMSKITGGMNLPF